MHHLKEYTLWILLVTAQQVFLLPKLNFIEKRPHTLWWQ